MDITSPYALQRTVGDETAGQPVISISNLSKTYATGFQALKNINLEIRHGEIFALLGPNGAGKTTLIGIVCGIVNPSAGSVSVGGCIEGRTQGRPASRSGPPGSRSA